MSDLYLRSNVKVEPLVDQWYAWSHLIPPTTAARNLTERHLKIMESYINAPRIHATAVKNPKMLGGPFIDYAGGRVPEIKFLRDQTKRARAGLLQLSAAIHELEEMLRRNATGCSLQPLYSKVPELLKGYVELGYDLNNSASVRYIEPLLYRSKYYQRDAQSLMLSLVSCDDRPFVLSTPRLESPDAFHLRIPFDNRTVDWLFRLKRTPAAWDEIHNQLPCDHGQIDLLKSFFTEEPPPPYSPYKGSGIRWRYFGHACILIEIAGVSMLFDPVLSYTYESDISRYTYDDLPDKIDYAIITHNHQDHVLFETILQIRHKVRTFVVPANGGGHLQDPSVRLVLQNVGCRNVVELRELDSIEFEGGSLMGVPFLGEHADLDIQSKLAYLVRIGRRALLFAADSCNIEPALYRHLYAEIGDVDALFLGMECDGAPLSWLYGPLLTQTLQREADQSRRLAGSDFNQALSLVDTFNCKEAYVYAMGQEPWLNYVMSLKYTDQSRPIIDSNRLIDVCKERGIWAERLYGEKEILLE
jgi:L-ascorbate metabolism protein UlaG (beta-lactamase superfamily)